MLRPKDSVSTPKTSKRSILGLLFNPQLGPAISPLRDTTRIFLHLVAMVFSMYGLFPKDHPALRDEKLPLSLFTIIHTAWNRLEFNRAGLAKVIIFFAVTGMMAFSGLMAIFTLLSLFVAHAHAAGTSSFDPESQDLAQSWLDYLFNGPSGTSYPSMMDDYGETTAQMSDPFAGGVALQNSLISALAFYSDAILIVAAIILFYHLTAMVVETAHHGVPMGKRASQIWAPIRLVVAIGLLVPVDGGLNCGQFLVIKMAELGSGMASQMWSGFLNSMASYAGSASPPAAPDVQKVASDIIRMEACRAAWNQRIDNMSNSGTDLSSSKMNAPTGTPTTIGNVSGTKYSYSSTAFGDTDICGYYFIPDGNSGSDSASSLNQKASSIMASAISSNQGTVEKAAQSITQLIPPDGASSTSASAADSSNSQIKMNPDFQSAVSKLQSSLGQAMSGLTNSGNDVQSAIGTIKPYGWVMAGAFLNTIARMQADIANAAASSTPTTEPPALKVQDSDRGNHSHWGDWFSGGNSDTSWNIRKKVSEDMASYDYYQDKSVTSQQLSDKEQAQCGAMVGLNAPSTKTADALDWVFAKIDWIASQSGVWTSGAGKSCGAGTGKTTFRLGIVIDGKDPIAQMAALGHANLNVAAKLAAMGMGSSIASGFIPNVGPGKIAGAAMNMGGSMANFAAMIFFACGFTLAFLVPLMPFMRFFFAVLSWFAAIVEAIIAVPLIALAHLNPEGEGLPGQQARNAYFFVFNLFLRPILTVFGLICGLIVFLIAVSFLNYAYAIAVSGAGGTAYGHATMSKFVYSVLYVAILYISANHSFQLIDHLPKHALSWMGANGQAMPEMGDAGKVESVGALISSYGGQKLMMGLGSGAQQAGGKLQGHFDGKRADAKSAGLAALSEKSHDARTDRVVAAVEKQGQGHAVLGAAGHGDSNGTGGGGDGSAAPTGSGTSGKAVAGDVSGNPASGERGLSADKSVQMAGLFPQNSNPTSSMPGGQGQVSASMGGHPSNLGESASGDQLSGTVSDIQKTQAQHGEEINALKGQGGTKGGGGTGVG